MGLRKVLFFSQDMLSVLGRVVLKHSIRIPFLRSNIFLGGRFQSISIPSVIRFLELSVYNPTDDYRDYRDDA